ncbi:MAG TPA: tripartite tricarboxylate transporter TctB family protein [Burkholderiales bacterium]|nr:tripartite tricarboxylate transporter TctB family protein [Burkholderiales bacterium]
MASSANRLYGLAWAVFGAAVLIASWRMDRLASLSINPWSAPGLMPGVLGVLLIVFGLALALRPTQAVEPGAGSWSRTLLAVVLCVVFAGGLLGRGLPFWLTSAGFLFAAIFAFRRIDEPDTPRARMALSSAAIAAAAALVVSVLFQEVFLVRLP